LKDDVNVAMVWTAIQRDQSCTFEEVSVDNDVSAAIITLLCHISEKFQGMWWTADEYCDMLRRGGLKDDVNVAMLCCLRERGQYSQHPWAILTWTSLPANFSWTKSFGCESCKVKK
jgi:hypothetical protein